MANRSAVGLRTRAEDGTARPFPLRLRVLATRQRRRLSLAVYAAAVIAPLALVFAGPAPPARGPALEFASAVGIAGLAVLALQLVLPSRLRSLSRPVGIDVLVRFHRQIGKVGLGLVLLHLVVLVADEPARLALLDPRTAPWRARAGVLGLLALLALVAISVRPPRALPYRWWRTAHLVLGTLVVVLNAAHVVGIDHYLMLGRERALVAVTGLAGVAALVHLRVARPLRAGRHPYRVEQVRPERGGAQTLVLRADGHPGRPFRPGQFAWLRLGSAPFVLEEHPFSFASSAARPDRPEFTIKAAGDFTASVASVAPGTPVLLDGPHGSAAPSDRSLGLVLIAGGIGVTPAMSVLRTLAERGDARPHLLVYANGTWEGVTFREELETLAERLRLRVVHVLAQPPEGFTGERGLLSAEILRRHLPDDRRGLQFLVCGPPPMLRVALAALRELGVPPARVHAERFTSR